MLDPTDTVLLIVDVQGKLARRVRNSERLIENVRTLIRGAQVLDLPLLWVEQNPQGLGPTVPEVAELLSGRAPIAKMSFDSCRNERFVEALEALGRRQVLVAGIEAHVCVYQTVAGLMKRGYEAHVVADAVSSRAAANRRIGLEKMRDHGAAVTSVETALFELLGEAGTDRFRAVLALLK